MRSYGMSCFSPSSNIPEYPVGGCLVLLDQVLVLENVKAKLHTKANYIILNLDFYFVAFCVYVHFNPFLCKKSAVDVSFFFFFFVCPKKCYNVSIEIGGCILHMPCMSTLCLWTNKGRSVCMCGQSASFNILFENHRSKRTKQMDLSVCDLSTNILIMTSVFLCFFALSNCVW